jgi:large subunit ribosomal protein L9
MKVILLADHKPLGKRGDLVDVADGFANNFLLRRKLATVATPGAIKQLEQQNNAKARRAAEEVANAQEVADKLEAMVLEIPAKAGGNGRLFGTVTNANVAEAIEAALAVRIDKHKIEMKDGIKALGLYPIEVRLGNSIVAKSNIKVVAAKG